MAKIPKLFTWKPKPWKLLFATDRDRATRDQSAITSWKSMAKRSNPFNGGAHQLKTHVGVMEFAKTNSGRSTLARIQSDTMQCLREGAKKVYAEQSQNSQYTDKNNPTMIGGVSNPANLEEICKACNNPDVVCRCSFCNSLSCSHCFRLCSSCESYFCPICAIISYDNSSEIAYCLTCIK